jgi:hypothetical protein
VGGLKGTERRRTFTQTAMKNVTQRYRKLKREEK